MKNETRYKDLKGFLETLTIRKKLLTKFTLQVAVESPQSGVVLLDVKHDGLFEVLSHDVSPPHLQIPLSQVFEIDKSHKDVPQRHWHTPSVDVAVSPVPHVTPVQGSKREL